MCSWWLLVFYKDSLKFQQGIPLPRLDNDNDVLVWKGSSDWSFSIKLAYELIKPVVMFNQQRLFRSYGNGKNRRESRLSYGGWLIRFF